MSEESLTTPDPRQQKPFTPPKPYFTWQMLLDGRKLPPGSQLHQHQQEKLRAEQKQRRIDQHQHA